MSSNASNESPQRKIIHVDMDAFYASVEQREKPELKGKPVVVGGDPNSRGVVASASYEARKFGVRSAMSCSKAKQLCPQAIFVYPQFRLYKEASNRIHEIFESVTDKIEPLSLDEAYLDVTENKLGEPSAMKIAIHIKKRIHEELRLTASAGAAPNKFLAKLASDMKKPDGLVVIPPEKIAKVVERLPVEKLWGVGPATAEQLNKLGFYTTADIRRCSVSEFERYFGSYARFLHGLAHGVDTRPVESEWERKSSGSETTFDKDIVEVHELTDALEDLCQGVAEDLKKDRPGKTITLKLRYSDFSTITRSETLLRHTDSPRTIFKTAKRLLLDKTEAGNRPVRLIGVSVSGLLNLDEPYQLWLDFPLE